MIRIQAIAPFRYQYQQKIVWLTSGECMYLNPSNASQKEELKFILSSRFTYKEYVYIDLSSVDSELRQEMNEEDGFYPIETYYPLPEEVCPIVPASFTAPYQEPIDSPYLNPIITSIMSQPIDTSNKGIVEQTALPIDITCLEPLSDKEANRISRSKELTYTSARKVRGISDKYGIEYTNKNEAIEKILDIEFEQE
jgi:hypothetical protein